MAHSPDRPDREFSVSQTYEDMAENLFAAPPLGLDKLFDDPIVRRRIGEIICLERVSIRWNRDFCGRTSPRKRGPRGNRLRTQSERPLDSRLRGNERMRVWINSTEIRSGTQA